MGTNKRKANATGDESNTKISEFFSVALKRCPRKSPPSPSPPMRCSGTSQRQLRRRRLEFNSPCSPSPVPAVQTPPDMEDSAVEEASVEKSASELEGSERMTDEEDSGGSANVSNVSEKVPIITRKATRMLGLRKLREKGEKLNVEFDEHTSAALGEEGSKLHSFIGALVRQKVNITYKSWHAVPKEVKEEIWADVEAHFNVDRNKKHLLIMSAGEKFKCFKCYLYITYVKTMENCDVIHPKVRRLYPHIQLEQWKEFVEMRRTPEFLELSNKNSKRKKLYKHVHRLSRKGYAKLEREMRLEAGTSERINRALLWKRAHQDKNGLYKNKATQRVADRIDFYFKQAAKKEFVAEGTHDELTKALETPEHPGRVRGQSLLTRRKDVFAPHRAEDVQLSKLRNEFDALKAFVREFINQRLNTPAENFHEKTEDNIQKGTRCELSKDVANGIVHQNWRNSGDNFSSETVIEENAELPVPFEELQTISEALLLRLQDSSSRIIPDRTMSGNPVEDLQQQNKKGEKRKEVQEVYSEAITNSIAAKPLCKMPVSLRPIVFYAKSKLKAEGLASIELPREIVGYELMIHLGPGDILQFADMEEISAPCISLYNKFLYSKCVSEELKSKFSFRCPSHVDTDINQLGSRAKSIDDAINRTSKGQIVLAPYSARNQWNLGVIDPWRDVVYWIDPNAQNPPADFKNLVNLALQNHKKSHLGEKMNSKYGSLRWIKMKAPKAQIGDPGNGLLVMRYMMDIIYNKWHEGIPPNFGAKIYSAEDIDEVRSDWATFLQQYMSWD